MTVECGVAMNVRDYGWSALGPDMTVGHASAVIAFMADLLMAVISGLKRIQSKKGVKRGGFWRIRRKSRTGTPLFMAGGVIAMNVRDHGWQMYGRHIRAGHTSAVITITAGRCMAVISGLGTPQP